MTYFAPPQAPAGTKAVLQQSRARSYTPVPSRTRFVVVAGNLGPTKNHEPILAMRKLHRALRYITKRKATIE